MHIENRMEKYLPLKPNFVQFMIRVTESTTNSEHMDGFSIQFVYMNKLDQCHRI